MSNSIMKVKILARAELALAYIHLQRAITQSAYFLVAVVFVLLGLGMFNYAAFYAISSSQSPAVAALWVALIDIAVAAALALFARKAGPKASEEKLAREIRDLADAELNRDIEQVKEEISQIVADVRSIGDTFSSFSGAATNLLAPFLGLVVKKPK